MKNFGYTVDLLAKSIEKVQGSIGVCDTMRLYGAANNLYDVENKLQQVQKRVSVALDLLEGDTVDWARVSAATAILKGNIEPA